MSDNGHSTEDYYNWNESYGGNGGGGFTGKWRGAKGSFFEGGIRVPAVISYPKLFPQGETRDQAIINLDILPTICEILDIPKPKNKLDGKSILDIITNMLGPRELADQRPVVAEKRRRHRPTPRLFLFLLFF